MISAPCTCPCSCCGSPPALGATVQWWASDPAWDNPADGAEIVTVRDSSGNGFDGTASGATKPLYEAAGINGRPSYRFNGGFPNWINTADVLPDVYPQTWLVVMERTVLLQTGIIIAVFDGGTLIQGYVAPDWGWVTTLDSGGTFNVSGPQTPSVDPMLLRLYVENGFTTMWVNETQVIPRGAAGAPIDLADHFALNTDNVSNGAGPNTDDWDVAYAARIPGDVSTDPAWDAWKRWANRVYDLGLPV